MINEIRNDTEAEIRTSEISFGWLRQVVVSAVMIAYVMLLLLEAFIVIDVSTLSY